VAQATAPGTPVGKRAAQVFGALASAVALLVAVTSLVDWLSRTLDDPAPPAPPQIDARVESVALRDRAITLEDYARSIGASARGLPAAERRETGWTFAVRVRLKGGVDERFPLLWTIHAADSGERLSGAPYNQDAEVTFTPRARDHSRSWPIWVPYPPRPGRFFLRTTLTDHKGQPVDERDSKPVVLADVPG
jgi:hypothetical protein